MTTPKSRWRSMELLAFIHDCGGSVTCRLLTRKGPCYRNCSKAEAKLSRLVKAGYGRWSFSPPGVKGGRPSRTFHLQQCPTVQTLVTSRTLEADLLDMTLDCHGAEEFAIELSLLICRQFKAFHRNGWEPVVMALRNFQQKLEELRENADTTV